MATAEELLNSLTVEDHIVVGSDRRITVPAALKRIAVQYDHDIETVTFDCPRYWDGIDMSKMDIYVNYQRSDGYKDAKLVDKVRIDDVDDTIMHFDWTITRNVTMVKGAITISICIKETDTDGKELRHWNSERNSEMSVSEGLECSEQIPEEYPDVLAKIVKKVDSIIDDNNNIIANDIKLSYLKEITVDGETTIDRTLKKSSGSIIQNIKVDDIDVFNLSDKNIELSATKKYHDNLVIVNGKISVIKNIRKLTIDSRFGKYWKQATAKSSSGGRTFSKRFYIDINSLIDSEGNTLLTPEELEIFNKGEMVFFTDSGYSSHFSTYITKQPYTHDRFYLDQSSSEYIRLHIFDTNATNILVSANDESIYHEIGSIEIPEGEYDIRTESIDFYFGIVSPKTIDIETLYSEEWKNLIKLYNYDSVVSANAISDFNDEVSEISLNTNVILDNFVDMIADLKTKNYTTDSEMSNESTNPVQNKVVKKYIDDILGDVETSLENIIAKYGLGGDGV